MCFQNSHITYGLLFSLLMAIQQQEQDPTNLYISNLPLSMDEQELENMLKHYGQVISTRILRDSNGTSRGVGFARSVHLTLAQYEEAFTYMIHAFKESSWLYPVPNAIRPGMAGNMFGQRHDENRSLHSNKQEGTTVWPVKWKLCQRQRKWDKWVTKLMGNGFS